MCGVIGFFDKKGFFEEKELRVLINKMATQVSHRGRDAQGVDVHNGIAMGHTRLSIVDLSPNANQPFSDKTGMFVYNGEIYNHLDLRANELELSNLESKSDSLTLFGLLKTKEVRSVLKEIAGMYAFAYFDKTTEKLTLAIDKFGIKPLYYYDSDDIFAWASEAKALFELPGVEPQFNEELMGEYLTYRYALGPETLFSGIKRLLPGQYIEFDLNSHKLETAYHYQPKTTKRLPSQKVSQIIKQSVADTLMSDVEVGVQLSGGIDSSLVAWYSQRLTKNKIHTFSIGFGDDKWNEFKYSDFVAQKIESQHHKVIITPQDFLGGLKEVIYHLDEPLVHPNTIPMYLLAKEARKYVKVLLTGEGADEVFCGYRRYDSLTQDVPLVNLLKNSQKEELSQLGVSYTETKYRTERIDHAVENSNDNENQMSLLDLTSYLPHVLIRQDKAGMMANIENRVPFLYEPVAEYGLSLSGEEKVGKFGPKTPLKELALTIFPEEFVLRRKCGFGLPIKDWMRNGNILEPLLQEMIMSEFFSTHLNMTKIEQLVLDHTEDKFDHSNILFTLLSLHIWHQVFFY